MAYFVTKLNSSCLLDASLPDLWSDVPIPWYIVETRKWTSVLTLSPITIKTLDKPFLSLDPNSMEIDQVHLLYRHLLSYQQREERGLTINQTPGLFESLQADLSESDNEGEIVEEPDPSSATQRRTLRFGPDINAGACSLTHAIPQPLTYNDSTLSFKL
jgi:hypothetical protein